MNYEEFLSVYKVDDLWIEEIQDERFYYILYIVDERDCLALFTVYKDRIYPSDLGVTTWMTRTTLSKTSTYTYLEDTQAHTYLFDMSEYEL